MPAEASLLDRIRFLEQRIDQLERSGAGSSSTYRKVAVFTKTAIADNVATAIFTVTTVNESGSTDGGGYICHTISMCGHALTNDTTNAAARMHEGVFIRVNKNDGVNADYEVQLHETASGAATASATRDLDTISGSVTDTSNTVATYNLQFDLTGTGVTTGQVVCWVELLWYGFLTAPVLAAA